MKLLEERILKDGNVLGKDILKVDSFLTHQVDYSLMREIGRTFAQHFKHAGITKVVTIEVIEKSFQNGRELLENAGQTVVSLARVERFEDGKVIFKEADI